MKIQRKTFDFAIKEISDETGELTGYGSVTGNVDRHG